MVCSSEPPFSGEAAFHFSDEAAFHFSIENTLEYI